MYSHVLARLHSRTRRHTNTRTRARAHTHAHHTPQVWDEDFRFEVANDAVLQSEPLEFRVACACVRVRARACVRSCLRACTIRACVRERGYTCACASVRYVRACLRARHFRNAVWQQSDPLEFRVAGSKPPLFPHTDTFSRGVLVVCVSHMAQSEKQYEYTSRHE